MVCFCLFVASSLILRGCLFVFFFLPPPPPQKKKIKDGKIIIARFSLRAASTLIILGNGSLLFQFFDPLNPNHFTLSLQAVSLLKKGGVLVYSTCTITSQENEQQVAWALKSFPCLRLEKQVSSHLILLVLKIQESAWWSVL